MPAIPPALSEWLALLTQPAVILLGVGLIVNQQNKRIDDLREDMNKRMDDLNKRMDDLREDMKAMKARQQESMRELREDNKALNEKLDRLLEARFSTLS